MIKTLTELREYFWALHPEFADKYRKTYRQNQYSCDIRTAWVFFVDHMERDQQINEKLAQRATL